ncbi:amidohydrolase family protein [Shouchella clausii]|uniref:amidohydrolase family protein n=1 Tax=Shouchella clausii TaxID=79880 RepID=UPI000D1FC9E6|nr:amidohydrolase family protein [Shouchella clausii]PTL22647.1 hypothetical protein DA802_11830 [Shouchella clausii]
MTDKVLFKGGTILTLDHKLGVLNGADLLVEGSKIAAVEQTIEGVDAEIVDAAGMIVMPGLVDTHRHTWQSIIRGIGSDWSLQTYLQSIYFGNLGSKRRPEDDYIAQWLGAVEALDGGVTTLLDWTMINSDEHTEQLIAGLRASGIRARFAYGSPGEESYWNRESRLDLAAKAEEVKNAYFASDGELVTMALAIRGPEFSSWEATIAEIEEARRLGLVCSMHLGFGNWGAQDRSVTKLHKAGLLGPDLNIVHGNAIANEELELLRDFGGSLSITPEIEMMMGHGYPVTGAAIERGVTAALGVDVVTSTGGDLFAQMKFALQAERAKENQRLLDEGIMPEQVPLSTKQMLEAATIEGAKALILEDKIGTLTPGKEADLIMLRGDDVNLLPVTDPFGAVAQAAHPGNVDSVFVAGKAKKRNGQLVGIDKDRLKKQAVEARDFMLASR